MFHVSGQNGPAKLLDCWSSFVSWMQGEIEMDFIVYTLLPAFSKCQLYGKRKI